MSRHQAQEGLELIQNPPPGSKLAVAKEVGIDLSLLLDNLSLTPAERLQRLVSTAASHEELRRAAQQFRRK